MPEDQQSTHQFAFIEYNEASTAYFKGVEIGFTVMKHYVTLNALLVAVIGALATLEQKNQVLPSPLSIARFVPWLAFSMSGLLALALRLYWRHIDNCSERCEKIEERYGGKLFKELRATSGTSFGPRQSIYAIITIVSVLWFWFLFRARLGRLPFVDSIGGFLP